MKKSFVWIVVIASLVVAAVAGYQAQRIQVGNLSCASAQQATDDPEDCIITGPDTTAQFFPLAQRYTVAYRVTLY